MKGRLSVLRSAEKSTAKTYYCEYRFEYSEGRSVMDVLDSLNVTIDCDLSYDKCCGNGKCGVCSLEMNGKPVLPCITCAEPDMVLKPLRKFKVIKDLIVDRSDTLHIASGIRPWRLNDSIINSAICCIGCGCCVSVCPAVNDGFPGPASIMNFISQCSNSPGYDAKPDNNLIKDLLKCIECGSCSKICPVSLNPFKCISDLKNSVD